MKLLIDDARIDAIRRISEYYPVSGVTTNPTILARCGKAPYEALREIRAFIGAKRDLHVQVVALDAAGMQRDAERIIWELGEGTFIKIPCVPEGFKAMKTLAARGFRTTGTAVYSPMQALLAAQCGADYVAPYVNRMDGMGYDGVAITRQIQRIFDAQGLKTQVLAASFRNTQQVLDLAEAGVGAATVAPDVIESFLRIPAVGAAVRDFTEDFARVTGPGVTMENSL